MRFNSRPHEEVDEDLKSIKPDLQMFQLTTSRRGRPANGRYQILVSSFQLTTSRRGRLRFRQPDKLPDSMFQLTTSRRGRRFFFQFLTYLFMFQLTTSRRGRRSSEPVRFVHSGVSTHDLTKRSTISSSSAQIMRFVSTHDLTKRSTFMIVFLDSFIMFQLTTSRRGRHLWRFVIFVLNRFNSRPHEEVDFLRCHEAHCAVVSTHDLTKRSTSILNVEQPPLYRFNSRPHEEVDRRGLSCCPGSPCFNSRPHEEVDGQVVIVVILPLMFQLTTSRRGRRCR